MRHLLAVHELKREEIDRLFEETARLKSERADLNALAGKTLGLLFLKPSVRTRVSFEVGMAQLGGRSLYIGPVELEQGKREAPKDVARVLSRYLDGLVVRTFHQREVAEMARFSSVPVINGLSDEHHPCQALADLFTVQEKLGQLRGVKIAYVGDGNNVCNSLLEGCALMGAHLSMASPAGYRPDAKILQWAQKATRKSRAKITLTSDPKKAVAGAAVVYTDVWTSMGQESQRGSRQRVFRPFQVNSALLKRAARGALFMHCLPAHRGEEVTDEVMDSQQSIVYDQAENRLHVQKAILLRLLAR